MSTKDFMVLVSFVGLRVLGGKDQSLHTTPELPPLTFSLQTVNPISFYKR